MALQRRGLWDLGMIISSTAPTPSELNEPHSAERMRDMQKEHSWPARCVGEQSWLSPFTVMGGPSLEWGVGWGEAGRECLGTDCIIAHEYKALLASGPVSSFTHSTSMH